MTALYFLSLKDKTIIISVFSFFLIIVIEGIYFMYSASEHAECKQAY